MVGKTEDMSPIDRVLFAKLAVAKALPLVVPLCFKVNKIESISFWYKPASIIHTRIYYKIIGKKETTGSIEEFVLVINPELVNITSNEHLIFTIAHELMHIAFRHSYRTVRKKYKSLFNIVEDAIINHFLEKVLANVINKNALDRIVKLGVNFDILKILARTLRGYTDEELAKMTSEDIVALMLKDKRFVKWWERIENIVQKYSKLLRDLLFENINQTPSSTEESEKCEEKDKKKSGKGEVKGQKYPSRKELGKDKEGEEETETKGDPKEKLEKGKARNMEKLLRNLFRQLEQELEREFEKFGYKDEWVKYLLKEIARDILEDQLENLMSPMELRQLGDRIRELVERGRVLQKMAGTEYAGIEALLEIHLKPKVISWKDKLREIVSEIGMKIRMWTMDEPHVIYYILQPYNIKSNLPVLKKFGKGVCLIIGIDVSGSISDAEYAEFVNEIYNLTKDMEIIGYIVMWDVEATKVIEMKGTWNDTIFHELKKRKGYGGTTVASFFNKAKELLEKLPFKREVYAVILTDGHFSDTVTIDMTQPFKKVLIVLSSEGIKPPIQKGVQNVEVVRMS